MNTKHIIASLMAIAAMAAHADNPGTRTITELRQQYSVAVTNKTTESFCSALTTYEWREFIDDILSVNETNHVAAKELMMGPYIFQALLKPYDNIKPIIEEYDRKLAAAGFSIDVRAGFAIDMKKYQYLPCCAEAWISDPNNEKWVYEHKVSLAVLRAHKGPNGWSVPERLNICAEDPYYANVRSVFVNILMDSQLGIKRQLRKDGRTFVVKPGDTNPVQEAVDALVECFNAPKRAGIKEWVARWYPDYNWIDGYEIPDETIQDLKEKVLYGEISIQSNKTILRFALGLDGYNELVREYNGEK